MTNMADELEDAEFWLPSEFLTDEDILMDSKENFNKCALLGSNSIGRCFPFDLPYDSASSVLSSPLESSVASAETESDEEDSLLTGLTRQLSLSETCRATTANHAHEKGLVLSSSPQSTLAQVGSWSGRSTVSSSGSPKGPLVSSPPTTPQSSKNDAWDLIYQAAGQVARLKMNGLDGPYTNRGTSGTQKWLVMSQPPKNSAGSPFRHIQWQEVSNDEMLKQAGCIWSREVKSRWSYEQEVSQNRGVAAGGWNVSGRGFDPPPCAWPNMQVQKRSQPQPGDIGFREGTCLRTGYGYGYGFGSAGGCSGGGGGGVLKRERTGTGVFLPRRYGNVNTPSIMTDSRKKPGSSPANMQDLNKMGGFAEYQTQQARINFSFRPVPDYDSRNAALAQQRRNLRPEGSINHEMCLPPEWTY